MRIGSPEGNRAFRSQRRSGVPRQLLYGALLWGTLVFPLVAEDSEPSTVTTNPPPSSPTVPATKAKERKSPRPHIATENRVLVLQGLQVVQGKLSHDRLGYTVDQPAGRMLIPNANVLFECRDITEALEELRRRIPEKAPVHHLALAEWCVKQNLLNDARDEYQRALDLDPENEEIQDKLNELKDRKQGFQPPPAYPQPEPHDVELHGFPGLPVEPLGGLPRQAGAEFTRRIQPILMNSCSAAKCHGPESKRPFHLVIVKPDTQTRKATEENLQIVLKFIDRDFPDQSLLLRGHRNGRGLPTSPFDNPRLKTSERIVRDWIGLLNQPDLDARSRSSRGDDPASLNVVNSIMKTRERTRKRLEQAQALKKAQQEVEERVMNAGNSPATKQDKPSSDTPPKARTPVRPPAAPETASDE